MNQIACVICGLDTNDKGSCECALCMLGMMSERSGPSHNSLSTHDPSIGCTFCQDSSPDCCALCSLCISAGMPVEPPKISLNTHDPTIGCVFCQDLAPNCFALCTLCRLAAAPNLGQVCRPLGSSCGSNSDGAHQPRWRQAAACWRWARAAAPATALAAAPAPIIAIAAIGFIGFIILCAYVRACVNVCACACVCVRL